MLKLNLLYPQILYKIFYLLSLYHKSLTTLIAISKCGSNILIIPATVIVITYTLYGKKKELEG